MEFEIKIIKISEQKDNINAYCDDEELFSAMITGEDAVQLMAHAYRLKEEARLKLIPVKKQKQ